MKSSLGGSARAGDVEGDLFLGVVLDQVGVCRGEFGWLWWWDGAGLRLAVALPSVAFESDFGG